MKIMDLHPSVKKCLRKYILSLRSYYERNGLNLNTKDILRKVSEKLKEVHVISVGGHPEDRTVLIQTVTERIYESGIRELRYHRVVYDRIKRKGSCTCRWFGKNGVCKHILKVLLLHHHGGSFYRRKLTYPAYKENRMAYTTKHIKAKVV